jgi:hypothetical protein
MNSTSQSEDAPMGTAPNCSTSSTLGDRASAGAGARPFAAAHAYGLRLADWDELTPPRASPLSKWCTKCFDTTCATCRSQLMLSFQQGLRPATGTLAAPSPSQRSSSLGGVRAVSMASSATLQGELRSPPASPAIGVHRGAYLSSYLR